jgi:hypothetical protein
MKYEHNAYTREVNGQQFYFVKRFIIIPELQNINPVLAGFGMHLQLDKACDIAGVTDAEERKDIYEAIQQQTSQAKVISLSDFKQSADKKIS